MARSVAPNRLGQFVFRLFSVGGETGQQFRLEVMAEPHFQKFLRLVRILGDHGQELVLDLHVPLEFLIELAKSLQRFGPLPLSQVVKALLLGPADHRFGHLVLPGKAVFYGGTVGDE